MRDKIYSVIKAYYATDISDIKADAIILGNDQNIIYDINKVIDYYDKNEDILEPFNTQTNAPPQELPAPAAQP